MSEVPPVPASTPDPLQRLVRELHEIPVVRRDPSLEMKPLLGIITDLANGQTPRFGLGRSIRDLRNRRHESVEGKFTIDDAIKRAMDALVKDRK